MTKLAAIVAGVLFVLAAVPAYAQTGACSSLSVGQTQNITAFSVCKRVTLNSVPEPSAGVGGICVMTGATAAQWESFYTNPPPGVSIANCGPTCTGVMYGGYCYYYGGRGQSCDTVCASFGGCDAAGTLYIGSGAPNQMRCIEAIEAVAFGVDSGGDTTHSSGAGCTFYPGFGNYSRITSPATTCAGTPYVPTIGQNTTPPGRICACAGQTSGGTASCALPWGGSTPHGTSVTAYVNSTSTDCTSSRDIRQCRNGVLIGSGTYQSCTPPPSCTGYSYGGYCYHVGAADASCDAACSTKGGCVPNGNLYILADPDYSGTRCRDAVRSLTGNPSYSPYVVNDDNPPYDTLGCTAYGYAYMVSNAQCNGGPGLGMKRVCACTY